MGGDYLKYISRKLQVEDVLWLIKNKRDIFSIKNATQKR